MTGSQRSLRRALAAGLGAVFAFPLHHGKACAGQDPDVVKVRDPETVDTYLD